MNIVNMHTASTVRSAGPQFSAVHGAEIW